MAVVRIEAGVIAHLLTLSMVGVGGLTGASGCGVPSYIYRPISQMPTDLQPAVAVREESFILSVTNGTDSPVYLDWSSARFVDIAGIQRPLRLRSEDNVGTPDVPLDPGATLIYQLEPAHYYPPPDRMWARRTSLRELVTYPDQFLASTNRQVVVHVGYCAGAPCPAADACCAATATRQTLEVTLTVVPEVR